MFLPCFIGQSKSRGHGQRRGVGSTPHQCRGGGKGVDVESWGQLSMWATENLLFIIAHS